MSKGLASFAVGFGGGYLNAQRQGALDKERQADRAMRQQEFDARMGEVNEKKELKLSLADAARPGTANENGATLTMADGTKTTYDSGDVAGSDFRQLRRADDATGNQTLASTVQPVGDAQPAQLSLSSALNKGTPAVPAAEGGSAKPSMGLSDVRMPMAPQRTATMNGKAFGSLADAQTAATAYNAPTAKAERQATAYDAAGQPDKASQIREMAQAVADKAFQRKLGAAMRFPGNTRHDGVAKLITESEYGPMAGKTLKAVPSEDGKTVTYNTVNPDGTLTPSGMSFSNDDTGIIKAAWMLDGLITPEQRYTTHVAERKAAAQQAKDAAVFDETKRHNLAVEGVAGAGKVPPGYRKTADGNLEAIPGGPATTIKPVAEKPLNDTQSKALLFGTRMREADSILTRLAAEGTTTSIPGSRGAMGGAISAMSSANKQMLDQAKRDFVNAVLRRESGAVIADTEFANADKQYFAQIGDDAKTIEQKSNNRKLALDGILLEVPEKQRNSLQPRAPSNAPMAMPKTIADMKPGSIYQTGRGPAKWNGTAFEAQ